MLGVLGTRSSIGGYFLMFPEGARVCACCFCLANPDTGQKTEDSCIWSYVACPNKSRDTIVARKGGRMRAICICIVGVLGPFI